MFIQTKEEETKIRKAALISTEILNEMRKALRVGIYPADIEKLAWDLCRKNNVDPSFYGVEGEDGSRYKYSCCISVNDEILHGIPSKERMFQSGDVVKLDFGIVYKGMHTDHCYTFILGTPSPADLKLVRTSKSATETAMRMAVHGATVGDLGASMYGISRSGGYDVLKNFVGHGIGYGLHEEPEIAAYGNPGRGEKLFDGMVICVECQLVAGTDQTITSPNGWTVSSADGKKSSMFEYMVIVRKNKPEILTPMQEWDIIIP